MSPKDRLNRLRAFLDNGVTVATRHHNQHGKVLTLLTWEQPLDFDHPERGCVQDIIGSFALSDFAKLDGWQMKRRKKVRVPTWRRLEGVDAVSRYFRLHDEDAMMFAGLNSRGLPPMSRTATTKALTLARSRLLTLIDHQKREIELTDSTASMPMGVSAQPFETKLQDFMNTRPDHREKVRTISVGRRPPGKRKSAGEENWRTW